MEQVGHCNCCGGNNFALRFQQPDFLYFQEEYNEEKIHGLLAKINHDIRHPIHTTDYILLLMVDRFVMLLGRYGVMTCALKKWRKKKPELFVKMVYNLAGRDR